jgi:hypothetical protein
MMRRFTLVIAAAAILITSLAAQETAKTPDKQTPAQRGALAVRGQRG